MDLVTTDQSQSSILLAQKKTLPAELQVYNSNLSLQQRAMWEQNWGCGFQPKIVIAVNSTY